MARLDDIVPDVAAIKELEAMPEGIYSAKVDLIILDKSGNFFKDKSGNRYLTLQLKITEPGFEGRKITDNYVGLEGNGAFRYKNVVEATSYPGTPKDTMELMGLDLKVKVSQDLYEGRVVNKVEGYLKHPSK